MPVGKGAPLPPLTATAIVRPSVALMLDEDGVIVIAGVTLTTLMAEEMPEAPLKLSEAAESGM